MAFYQQRHKLIRDERRSHVLYTFLALNGQPKFVFTCACQVQIVNLPSFIKCGVQSLQAMPITEMRSGTSHSSRGKQ